MITCPECGVKKFDHEDFEVRFCPSHPDKCDWCEVDETRLKCPECDYEWEYNGKRTTHTSGKITQIIRMMMPKFKDLTGTRFWRWVVLNRDFTRSNHRTYWNCQCDCGTIASTSGSNLVTGATKSCGCLNKEKTTKHGMNTSSEYSIWEGIKQRCCNPKSQAYNYYGGRGINICEEWKDDFQQFLKDVGTKPSKEYSLDRVDNNGNYTPTNVRWATKKEQANNRRKKAKLFDVDQLKAQLQQYIDKYGPLDANS